MPLLGATAVAIMAFAAIGTSDDSTGEFCRSLFQVVLVSLWGLSWVTAVTVTPRARRDVPEGPRRRRDAAIPMPAASTPPTGLPARLHPHALGDRGLVVGLFAVSLYGFGFVDRSFFPDSTRPQFMVDLWMPQGTHIDTTEASPRWSSTCSEQEGVTHVSSLVGAGGMRFLLTYAPEKTNSWLRAVPGGRRRLRRPFRA